MDDFYAEHKKEWREHYDLAKTLRNWAVFLGVMALILSFLSIDQLRDADYSNTITVPTYINYPAGYFESSGNRKALARVSSVEIQLEKGSRENYLYSVRNACITIYYFTLFLLLFMSSLLYTNSQTKLSSYLMKMLSGMLLAGLIFYFVDFAIIIPQVLSGIQFTELHLRLGDIGENNQYFYAIFFVAANSIWKASKKVAQMDLTYPASQAT